MRTKLHLRWACACVAVVVALAAGAAGARGAATPEDGRQLTGAYFLSGCQFSHRSPDDPIVFPRHPGLSHDHTFVGNTSTNAFSTLSSLKDGATSCGRKDDTAAYWAPTLLAGNKPVTPLGATIYYRRRTKAPPHAFPPGLKMVAGNSLSTRPQSYDVTYWQCILPKTDFNYQALRFGLPGRLAAAQRFGGIPRCGRNANLELIVNFPDCWNGRTLDSRNHKQHMAYAVAGRCPAAHPVPVPALTLVYRYQSTGKARLLLSSGGEFSGHADFFNAWHESELRHLVSVCLDKRRACGFGD